MEIEEIAFYVDGPTEDGCLKNWINKFYYKNPNIRRGPGNGKCFSVETYASKVAPFAFQNLNSNIKSIIFLPDFETRKNDNNITIESFAQKLKKEIISEIIKISQYNEDYLSNIIYVCPSDIMFENWIISDVDGIKNCKSFVINGEPGHYDGSNGSWQLDKMIVNKKYKKTTDAFCLFKYVSKENGITYSPSFKRFIEVLDYLISR